MKITKTVRFEIDDVKEEFISELYEGENEGEQKEGEQLHEHHKFLGIFLYTLGAFFFALTSITGKIAYFGNPQLNGFDYMLVRSVATMITSTTPVFIYKVNIIDVHPEYIFKFVVMTIGNALAMPCFYVSFKFVPATKASLVFNTNPIIVSLLGVLLLSEIIEGKEIMGMIGAFCGVVLLTITKSDSSVKVEHVIQILAMIGILIGSISNAFVCVFLRFFNKKHNYLLYPFYYAISLSILSIILLVVYPDVYNYSSYTVKDVALFSISGVTNIAGNFAGSYALKLEEASVLAPYMYSTPLFVFFFDLFMFKYSFSIFDIGGAIVVLFFLFLKLKIVPQKQAK